ncbi:MAG: hypothetical protein IPM53_08090 [Anaerolineaceae bacterium]|nr:hypothetical protein [Anaerolineaceae bacterium]
MKAESDKVLNQLVVTALTVFILVVLLLAALILRQLWLQQQIADISDDVQVNLEDLEAITEDIQRDLAENPTIIDPESLDEVAEALDDVDERLDQIEEGLDGLNEVAFTQQNPAEDGSSTADSDTNSIVAQEQVDGIFTVFAVLIGITSIIVAILLGTAVRIYQNRLAN